MQMTFSIPHDVHIGEDDVREIFLEYLQLQYKLSDDYRLKDGNIEEYEESHHCGAHGSWSIIRKATKRDREYFSIIDFINEERSK